jgi:hypothetical protein
MDLIERVGEEVLRVAWRGARQRRPAAATTDPSRGVPEMCKVLV